MYALQLLYTFKAFHSFNSSNNDSGYLFYNKKNFVTKRVFRIGRFWIELAEVVVHYILKHIYCIETPDIDLGIVNFKILFNFSRTHESRGAVTNTTWRYIHRNGCSYHQKEWFVYFATHFNLLFHQCWEKESQVLLI